MANKVESKVIGLLRQDSRFSDWWTSDDVAIPFFDGLKLPVIFTDFYPEEDESFLSEADAALTNFLAKTSDERLSITPFVYKNCMETVGATDYSFEEDVSLKDISDPTEVWNFVNPTQIYVSRRGYKERDIYIQIACSCTWDDEHGLQLVYRQGKKITRVSQQDGHLTDADANDTTDDADELLSAF